MVPRDQRNEHTYKHLFLLLTSKWKLSNFISLGWEHPYAALRYNYRISLSGKHPSIRSCCRSSVVSGTQTVSILWLFHSQYTVSNLGLLWWLLQLPTTRHELQAASREGRQRNGRVSPFPLAVTQNGTQHCSSHGHILLQWRWENEAFSFMVLSSTKTLLPDEVRKKE